MSGSGDKTDFSHFLLVSFRTHLRLTLHVGGTGCMYAAWIQKRLEVMVVVVVKVTMTVVVVMYQTR